MNRLEAIKARTANEQFWDADRNWLISEVDHLIKTLEHYGQHDADCLNSNTAECICGLDKAKKLGMDY
jgi:hypothetical protein